MFSDIAPFWSYANEDDFEYGFVKTFGDKLLITLLTASSQGGVVVLWDAATEKIEYISNGSYCIAVDMDEKKIYKLLDVQNFEVESNLQLSESPLNTMNAFSDDKILASGIKPPNDSETTDCEPILCRR